MGIWASLSRVGTRLRERLERIVVRRFEGIGAGSPLV